MQPVSMLMSNMNVEAMTHHAPNALAVAQDKASEAANESQRVHRKTENDEREQKRRNNQRDSFVKSEEEKKNGHELITPLTTENVKGKKQTKSFSFIA